jgi:hypothetical protein
MKLCFTVGRLKYQFVRRIAFQTETVWKSALAGAGGRLSWSGFGTRWYSKYSVNQGRDCRSFRHNQYPADNKQTDHEWHDPELFVNAGKSDYFFNRRQNFSHYFLSIRCNEFRDSARIRAVKFW